MHSKTLGEQLITEMSVGDHIQQCSDGHQLGFGKMDMMVQILIL